MNEDCVATALDALSPSEVLDSERLLSSFRAFFARGSARDFYELLPNQDLNFSDLPSAHPSAHYSPSLRDARNFAHQRARKPNSSASKPNSTDIPTVFKLPSAFEDSNLANEMQEAWGVFAANSNSQTQLHRLMRVFEGVLRAAQQPASFYRSLWSAHKDHVFDSNDATQSRIARLFQGRKLIDQESQRFECAGRLSLVFLAHDVEVIKAQDWKLAPGQSRQHAAVMSIANHLDVEPEEIKKEWRRSRNYIKLLEECGPASLLELGTGVNWYWEKALTKQDVTLLIQFIKEKMPLFASRIKDLNRVAGEMIIDGMLAYGWTREAIGEADTRLCNALALHCPEVFYSQDASTTLSSTIPEKGSLQQLEGSGLGNPPTFLPTPPPPSNIQLCHDLEIVENWDKDLCHAFPPHLLQDEAGFESFLEELGVGGGPNFNENLLAFDPIERRDRMQIEL